MKYIFFGTPKFGELILDRLLQAGLVPALVVTAPDKPVGRSHALTPPPVKVLAQAHGIPLLQPDRIRKSLEDITSLAPDFIVVAAYGVILPSWLIKLPSYGCLNVHPSLLPCHRGASPIQSAILSGDEKTGVTIMLMDELVDHGPIIKQEVLEDTDMRSIAFPELHDKLADLGGRLLVETIPLWLAGEIEAVPQDESKATMTSQITKEDGRIDWSLPAKDIAQRVRAFTPWPGTFTVFQDKEGKQKTMKILVASVLEQNSHGPFGDPGKTFLAPNNNIAVQTGDGFLVLEEMQVEGKKPVKTKEFLLGNYEFVGTVFK